MASLSKYWWSLINQLHGMTNYPNFSFIKGQNYFFNYVLLSKTSKIKKGALLLQSKFSALGWLNLHILPNSKSLFQTKVKIVTKNVTAWLVITSKHCSFLISHKVLCGGNNFLTFFSISTGKQSLLYASLCVSVIVTHVSAQGCWPFFMCCSTESVHSALQSVFLDCLSTVIPHWHEESAAGLTEWKSLSCSG